jgi:hypothetical protein
MGSPPLIPEAFDEGARFHDVVVLMARDEGKRHAGTVAR